MLSKSLHSLTISSSHAHNLRHHFHTSPPLPQPKANLFATVSHLFSDKSNNPVNLSRRNKSPNHLYIIKNIYSPIPMSQHKLSSNHPPTYKPHHQGYTPTPSTTSIYPSLNIIPHRYNWSSAYIIFIHRGWDKYIMLRMPMNTHMHL